MKKNKRGFVLMETIVVVTVLCVVLVILYGAYSKILIEVSNKSLHDNTEYIYKTRVIREFLEDKVDIVDFMASEYVVGYCSDLLPQYKNCNDTSLEGNELFSFMKIKGIYFVLWDKNTTMTGRFNPLEPTTQQYMYTIDEEISDEPYRIMVVMYESENEYMEGEYEYAHLRFGSRG